MLHEVAKDITCPKVTGLRLATAAAMVVEHAVTQTLPGSLYHFGIHVRDEGGVVQDAERLWLAALYLIYGWVNEGMKC